MYLSLRICICYLGSAKMMGGNSASTETCECVCFHPCLNDFSWVEVRCERNTNFLQESGRRVCMGGEKKLQVRGIFPLCSIQNNLWMQRCVLLTVMMWRGSCFLSAKVPCSICGLLCGYYIISMICRVCDPHSIPYSFSRFIQREHYH